MPHITVHTSNNPVGMSRRPIYSTVREMPLKCTTKHPQWSLIPLKAHTQTSNPTGSQRNTVTHLCLLTPLQDTYTQHHKIGRWAELMQKRNKPCSTQKVAGRGENEQPNSTDKWLSCFRFLKW